MSFRPFRTWTDSLYTVFTEPSRYIVLGLMLLATLCPVPYRPALGQTAPYRILSEAGAGFFGYGREVEEPETLAAIPIGLIGPERTVEGRHLRYGTAMAIEEANRQGGYRGHPYELVFRPDDGPWGMAAKQVVRLTYEDEVWAILGGLDGHHAHLAELIAAKAWIPVVTPCAPDLTIDYANVPWVFRCMPDDGQQARALVRQARHQGYERTVVLSEGERESRLGWERLLNAAHRERYPFRLHVEYDPLHPTAILPRLQHVDLDGLIIWGHPKRVLPLIRALRDSGVTAPVLGPSLLATPSFAEEARGLEDITIVAPYDMSQDDPEQVGFYQAYVQYAGIPPAPIAIYAYDAAHMILRAIERAGLNRARIRDELAHMSFDGLSGRIHFDPLGGNRAPPVLMTCTAGEWVCLTPGQPHSGVAE